MKPVVFLICLLAFPCFPLAAFAGAAAPATNSYAAVLGAVPRPELPAQVVFLLTKVGTADRQTAAVAIMQAVVKINSSASPVVVGAIAKDFPELAATAAATAAGPQPRLAAALARAAASAAPAQASNIVAAICHAAPSQYYVVATTVVRIVPAAANDVLLAVSATVPALKPYIEQALGAAPNSRVSVQKVLSDPANLINPDGPGNSASSRQISPPRPGPPSISAPAMPAESGGGGSGELPPGGRDYSRP